ncbi:MAG: hypothetical protein WA431_11930 [Candidatus Cybelea sp.]
MSTKGDSPDIAIDEVQTSLEISNGGTPGAADLRKMIVAVVKQCLSDERHASGLKEQDTRITDRAWRPNRSRS